MDSARLTILETVYHQNPDEDATSVILKQTINLKQKEQPYQRRQTLSQVAVPLDTGWVKNHSCLIISNEATTFTNKTPTTEQLESVAQQVVYVTLGVNGPKLIIVPGGSIRVTLSSVANCTIYSHAGNPKVLITAFPS